VVLETRCSIAELKCKRGFRIKTKLKIEAKKSSLKKKPCLFLEELNKEIQKREIRK